MTFIRLWWAQSRRRRARRLLDIQYTQSVTNHLLGREK